MDLLEKDVYRTISQKDNLQLFYSKSSSLDVVVLTEGPSGGPEHEDVLS